MAQPTGSGNGSFYLKSSPKPKPKKEDELSELALMRDPKAVHPSGRFVLEGVLQTMSPDNQDYSRVSKGIETLTVEAKRQEAELLKICQQAQQEIKPNSP